MPHASFNGLHVLSLESRRALEVEKLILTYGGKPLVVPAMRELPMDSNSECFAFAEALLAGNFDLVVFLTGVGVRTMLEIITTRYDREAILTALRNTNVAARGAKPLSALRELQVSVTAVAAEPTTWRELMAALEASHGAELPGMRVAVQEYGASNPELLSALVERTASVTKIPVYRWGLPLDLQPLRKAVLALIQGTVDIVLFMTAVQVIHLFEVAEQMGMEQDLRAGLRAIAVLSIGPTTTEELQHYGITPDFEPSRPKMGFLVNEAAQYAERVLATKRTASTPDLSAENSESAQDIIASQTEAGSKAHGAGGDVIKIRHSTPTMAGFRDGLAPLDAMREINNLSSSVDVLRPVFDRVVALVSSVIPCDSCLLYTFENDTLTLRASKAPHAKLLGESIAGWVVKHHEPVSLASRAYEDPRFSTPINAPEDRFEAILSVPLICASRIVGAINLQHRESYTFTDLQIRQLSEIGLLAGAEIERAQLESGT